MDKRPLDQLPPQKVASLASIAVHRAIADSVASGLPVTAMVDGRVQQLNADDPRLDDYRQPAEDIESLYAVSPVEVFYTPPMRPVADNLRPALSNRHIAVRLQSFDGLGLTPDEALESLRMAVEHAQTMLKGYLP